MQCENNLCIYCENDACILDSIALNRLAMCMECIQISVPSDVLNAEKIKLRQRYHDLDD